ncbi:MAG: glycosyltransferase family 2 protein [Acidiferrobacterales bacterium]
MSQKYKRWVEPKGHFVVEKRRDLWEWVLRTAIVAGLLGIIYFSFSGRMLLPLLHAIDRRHWLRMIARPSLIWLLVGTVFLVFRTFLWFRYRAFSPVSADTAPVLTVIIPAYNEGAMVGKSIDSVVAADYPRDRLEVLIVDDGSKDDTWEHIESAAARHAGIVTALRFDRNRGKRAALESGFRRARGEIVVTIDSDSVIERETLLAIAGPFRDTRVGAVAGKVAVYNRHEGLIPRMLHVRYILSFDLLRAVQSTYGTVYCCPGALAAYRVSALHEVLDDWVKQTFLGVPCTYGEDRALTNYILGRGYDTVYQRSAVVHTIVPLTYSKLCKMYLRWDRSYVREEIRFAGIVWKRPPVARIIAILDAVITNLRYPLGYATLAALIALSLTDPMTIVRVLFVMAAMTSLNMLYYLRSERSWDFLFGIFYAYFSFFALFWVFPYAVATVRSRSWLTR